MFHKYPSIENHYQEKFIQIVKELVSKDTLFSVFLFLKRFMEQISRLSMMVMRFNLPLVTRYLMNPNWMFFTKFA